jgi:ribulose-phosphate 3-epimerase
MLASPIVPAVIPNSAVAVADFLRALPGVPELHLDVVDGVFVPFTSWPYVEAGSPAEVLLVCEAVTLEVDLMVAEPLKAARAWIAAGADMLVFHIETISVEALTQFAQETAVTIGVAANNDTPNEALIPYLAVADYVQVMGIASIGAQGQPFDERALSRIAWLRAQDATCVISMDGSVNANTISILLPYRLDRYIVGSAISRAVDPKAAYTMFSSQALQQVVA